MILTAQQENAIRIMSNNVKNREAITVISGFAGT